MRRFEFSDGNSSKFWEVSFEGNAVTVRFGKLGAGGQTQTKSHATPAKAKAEHDKLVKDKTAKGYVEVTAGASKAATTAPAAEEAAPKKPKAASAKTEPVPTTEPGWIDAGSGYAIALVDGKVVCRNAKGQKLASVPKELKESDAIEELTNVREWLAAHERECLATVERWMLRSLPAPRAVLEAVWIDPAWRHALENAVVVPTDERGEREDDVAGFFRGVDAKKGIGVITLDGETVWIDAAAVAIPHPILLLELGDLRSLAIELSLTQGVPQLLREIYKKPKTLAEGARGLRDFAGAEFEQLNHALGLCRRLGYRVSGGSALARVWEGGRVFEARLWIGADDPTTPAALDELTWVGEDERPIPVAEVPAVAFSEGMRMGSQIYGGRKIPKEGDNA